MTTVSITPEGDKFRMTGTTQINGSDWPVNVLFNSEAQALDFATKHGYSVV